MYDPLAMRNTKASTRNQLEETKRLKLTRRQAVAIENWAREHGMPTVAAIRLAIGELTGVYDDPKRARFKRPNRPRREGRT